MNKKIFLFSVLLFSFFAALISCNKDDDNTNNVYSKTGIPMSPSQEPPPPPVVSSATGSIDASYNKTTKTLTYKVTWQNLTSDSIRGMHIHGLADPGFNAPILQTFSGYPLKASGSYSGTLFVDEVVFKESDILANKFYINIHTKAYPGGEIRGQLIIN
jgi:hypothetical protein